MHNYKKGWKKDLESHRPVSLPLVMEQILVMCHQTAPTGQPGLRPSQDWLRKVRSCLTNLISFSDQVTCLVDEGKFVDVSVCT